MALPAVPSQVSVADHCRFFFFYFLSLSFYTSPHFILHKWYELFSRPLISILYVNIDAVFRDVSLILKRARRVIACDTPGIQPRRKDVKPGSQSGDFSSELNATQLINEMRHFLNTNFSRINCLIIHYFLFLFYNDKLSVFYELYFYFTFSKHTIERKLNAIFSLVESYSTSDDDLIHLVIKKRMFVEIKIFLKYVICKVPPKSYVGKRSEEGKIEWEGEKKVANIFRPLPTGTVTETRNLYEWPDQC